MRFHHGSTVTPQTCVEHRHKGGCCNLPWCCYDPVHLAPLITWSAIHRLVTPHPEHHCHISHITRHHPTSPEVNLTSPEDPQIGWHHLREDPQFWWPHLRLTSTSGEGRVPQVRYSGWYIRRGVGLQSPKDQVICTLLYSSVLFCTLLALATLVIPSS